MSLYNISSDERSNLKYFPRGHDCLYSSINSAPAVTVSELDYLSHHNTCLPLKLKPGNGILPDCLGLCGGNKRICHPGVSVLRLHGEYMTLAICSHFVTAQPTTVLVQEMIHGVICLIIYIHTYIYIYLGKNSQILTYKFM